MTPTSGATVVTAMIRKAFDFLTERGFRVVKQSKGNGWAEVYYRKDSTGIVVSFEGRDQSVFVELCRLIDGTFPPKPSETRLHHDRVEIGYLLAVRAPDRIVPGYRLGRPPPSGGAEAIMAAQAANLREFASDFLDGDMAALEVAMPGLYRRATEVMEEKWGTAEPSLGQNAIQASAIFLGDSRADAPTTLAVHRVPARALSPNSNSETALTATAHRDAAHQLAENPHVRAPSSTEQHRHFRRRRPVQRFLNSSSWMDSTRVFQTPATADSPCRSSEWSAKSENP
jgi:hypothetical protein